MWSCSRVGLSATRGSSSLSRSTAVRTRLMSDVSHINKDRKSHAKTIVATAALGTLAGSGTLLYAASSDKETRQSIESALPFTKSIFPLILDDGQEQTSNNNKKKTAVESVDKKAIKEKKMADERKTGDDNMPSKMRSRPKDETAKTTTPPAPPLEVPEESDSSQKELNKEEKETKKNMEKKESETALKSTVTQDGTSSSSISMVDKKEHIEAAVPKPQAPNVEVVDDTKATERVERSTGDTISSTVVEEERDLMDDFDEAIESEALREREWHRRETLIREKLESEHKSQLKLQAEVNADMLQDALTLQRQQLSRQYLRQLDERVQTEMLDFKETEARLVGQLKGLKEALTTRVEGDKTASEAQHLWIVCSALHEALRQDDESNSSDSGRRSLRTEMESLRNVAKKDAFVDQVLQALPLETKEIGVTTLPCLKERFLKLERVARRTALIDEQGGSLFRYFISYLQSILIRTPNLDDLLRLTKGNSDINVAELNTFDIVALAKASLAKDDLSQCVKYLSLLKGQPRILSDDWIKEALKLLEVRLAADALIAHADAKGLQSLPQKIE